MSMGEIVAAVEAAGNGARHVVVTGGEPMMFKEVGELIAELKRLGRHVTVETAGTLWLENLGEGAIDLASVSPKLSNSVPWEREEGRFAQVHEKGRINLEVLRRVARGGDGVVRECQWKFVISRVEDVAEMEMLVQRVNEELKGVERIEREDILLMPEGVDVAALNERSAWVGEICKEKGYRFSPRLHVYLYGNVRGT